MIVFSQYDTIQIILLWEVTPKCYCLFRNECEKLNFFLNDALGKDIKFQFAKEHCIIRPTTQIGNLKFRHCFCLADKRISFDQFEWGSWSLHGWFGKHLHDGNIIVDFKNICWLGKYFWIQKVWKNMEYIFKIKLKL